MPAMAVAFDLGNVGADPVERHLILAYDQIYAIEYFHKPLRPYWRLKRTEASSLLERGGPELRVSRDALREV